MTAAERAFSALSDERKRLLLQRVFEILEYDEDGKPGGEWSNDTTQALGDVFGAFGVTFTDPNPAE